VPLANHLVVDVDFADEDLADRAPVAVDVDNFDARLLAESERRKRGLRLLSIRLVGLRGVDLGEADANLFAIDEQCQRVAIGDADDAPVEDARFGARGRRGVGRCRMAYLLERRRSEYEQRKSPHAGSRSFAERRSHGVSVEQWPLPRTEPRSVCLGSSPTSLPPILLSL